MKKIESESHNDNGSTIKSNRVTEEKENHTPKHLRKETAQWFDSVVNEYSLEPHHIRLLTLAAEAWDRAVQAREALEKHGLTYIDRFDSPKARPEVGIERDSRIAFARLIRELALDVSEPGEIRPPTITGKSGLRK